MATWAGPCHRPQALDPLLLLEGRRVGSAWTRQDPRAQPFLLNCLIRDNCPREAARGPTVLRVSLSGGLVAEGSYSSERTTQEARKVTPTLFPPPAWSPASPLSGYLPKEGWGQGPPPPGRAARQDLPCVEGLSVRAVLLLPRRFPR